MLLIQDPSLLLSIINTDYDKKIDNKSRNRKWILSIIGKHSFHSKSDQTIGVNKWKLQINKTAHSTHKLNPHRTK